MSSNDIHAVTGAFGYSGRYIAQQLIERGHSVRTLTNSTHRDNPFGNALEVHPFNFDAPEKLTESLRDVQVLYNTYWVRFNHRDFTHASAVRNTLTLFDSAKKAGVNRIVHISITNPSEKSHLEYFRGKAQLEKALQQSGLSYAILRPAVLFGHEDILINNIAWMLRKLPVFGVFGDGQYRLQPIFVEDLATIAVEQGAKHDDVIIEAIGPETFTFHDLVSQIGNIIGKRRPMMRVPPSLGYIAGQIIGKIVGDVIITLEEIEGLMQGKLYVDAQPAGWTKLTEWANENRDILGRHYASELIRRSDRKRAY